MAKYIVMSTEQKEGLEALRVAFEAEGKSLKKWSNYRPIEINTVDQDLKPYYILPLDVVFRS